MPKSNKKNMHVPLPEPLYARLRREAERTRRPATELVREAIVRWLTEQQRRFLHEEIQTYARAVAGTPDDLDRELEASSIEHLLADADQGEPAP